MKLEVIGYNQSLLRFGWQKSLLNSLKKIGYELGEGDIIFTFQDVSPHARLSDVFYIIDYPNQKAVSDMLKEKEKVLIFSSYWLRMEVLKKYPSLNGELTDVIYHGVDDFEASKHSARDEGYFLWLGSFDPRKSPEKLARLMKKSGKQTVFMGADSIDGVFEKSKSLYPEAKFELGVPEPRKWEYLSKCRCLVSFSSSENFWIPGLEAGYFRKPVIARRSPALEEVYGDSIILVDNEEEFLEAVERVDEDENFREKMGEKLRRRIDRLGLKLSEIRYEFDKWFKWIKNPREIDLSCYGEWIEEVLPKKKVKKLLNLGCGDDLRWDTALKEVADEVCHVDIRKTKLNNLVEDCHELPFNDKEFDFTLCIDILEHNKNQIQILKEIDRVSKDYFILFDTPESETYKFDPAHKKIEFDYKPFTPKGVGKLRPEDVRRVLNE